MRSWRRFGSTLAAVLVISVACGAQSPTGSSTQSPKQERSDIAILCSEPAVVAGNEPRSGDRLCGDAVLGNRLGSVDFGRDVKLPAEILAVYSNQPVAQEDAAIRAIEGGAAAIHVAKATPEAVVALSFQAENAAVIVDFKQPSSGSSVGIAIRCSSGGCAFLRLDSDGKYWLVERNEDGASAHVLTSGDLNADTGYPAPRLNATEPNRLVVWVKAKKMAAQLNGRLLAQETIQPASAGNVFFFLRSVDETQAADVRVLRAYFYDV